MKRMVVVACAVALSAVSFAETKTWKGTTANASRAANWEPAGVPQDGDDIVFNADVVYNCTWDIDIVPASWTQDGYTGTVTFITEFDEYEGTAPKYVEIAGDVTLKSGMWKGSVLAKTDPNLCRRYRLYFKIHGNLTVGADAQITAQNGGYKYLYCVEPGGTWVSGNQNHIAGSYGGVSSRANDINTPFSTGAFPYGSVTKPTEPGSGSTNGIAGGGVVQLEVDGDLVLDGTIDADARGSYYIGSGGSVYIRTATIRGSGRISAGTIGTDFRAPNNPRASGGRISVVLTKEGETFDAFDPLTQMSTELFHTKDGVDYFYSAPGTIYVETASDTPDEGWLIVKGTERVTTVKASNGGAVAGYNGGTVHYRKISLVNGVKAVVPPGATLDLRGTELVGNDVEGVSRYGVYLLGGSLIAPDDYCHWL